MKTSEVQVGAWLPPVPRARQRAAEEPRGDPPSVRVDVREDGEPLRMRQVGSDRWRKRACGLVEEHMLLANEAVVETLEAVGMDAFCRSHAASSERDVSRIRSTARVLSDGKVMTLSYSA